MSETLTMAETATQKPFAHVSASQVDLFRRCKRAWYNRYVLGLKSPQTAAQARGTAVHAEIEHYLKTGEIRETEFKRIVEVVIEHLPDKSPSLLIEHKIVMETFPGGPEWIGYIDVAEPARIPSVYDTKTTSDFRYCKTPAELGENLQLLTYARWAMSEWSATSCEILHVYGRTRGKPAAHEVSTVVDFTTTEAFWSDIVIPNVREMIKWWSSGVESDAVPPTTDACGMFGGCAYRQRCGLDPLAGRFPVMGKALLLDRLKAAKQSAAMAAQAPVSQAPDVVKDSDGIAAGAVGVVPPDAPSRETTPAEAAELTAKPAEAPKRGRGRPKKQEVGVSMEDVTPVQVTISKTDVASDDPDKFVVRTEPRSGPIIYVKCLPVKGGEGKPVLLEEWLAPIVKAVADAAEVADYRMIRYEAKAYLAAAIRDAIETCPPVLLADPYGSGTDVALEILIPHARQVIRGY